MEVFVGPRGPLSALYPVDSHDAPSILGMNLTTEPDLGYLVRRKGDHIDYNK